MNRAFLTAILFSLCISIFSQDVTYNVFFYNGEVQYKSHQKTEWNKLDEFDIILSPHDSIYLKPQSELFLINNQKDQYYLSLPGKNKLSEITDSINALGGESLISKYADFIWDEFNKADDNLDDYAEKHMREKGGVSRAINIPEIFSPIYGTSIIDDKIIFSWENLGAEKYTLSFWDSDKNGKCFFSIAIEDTFAIIPTNLPWMPRSKVLYYSITEANKQAANFFPIKILDTEEKEEIESKLKELELDDKIGQLSKQLLIASYFEKNNLLQKAQQTYKEILQLYPDSKVIEKYFSLFTARSTPLNLK